MFGASYEILALRGGSWSIEATAKSQKSAEEAATKILGRPKVDGVRVVKEMSKAISELSPEEILFEKLRPTGGDKVFIQDIDTAPLCRNADDLFAPAGRATINRLFRAYLDKNSITAAEVLHSSRELKRIFDEGTMLFSAASKTAGLQASKYPGAPANERRDQIMAFANDLNTRARMLANKKLPSIRLEGFEQAMKRTIASSPQEEIGNFLGTVIAADLVEKRSFLGKLNSLLEWSMELPDRRMFSVIDDFVADCLHNAETLRDVIGPQRDLGSALVNLIALAEGELSDDEDELDELTIENPDFAKLALGRFISAGALPQAKEIVMDRVRRQLEGKGPLSKGDREEEREVFAGLIDRLIPEEGVVGGPQMAQAVTTRQSSIINKGGKKGSQEAAASLLPVLRDPCRKTGYLLSLRESEMGQDFLGPVIEELLTGTLMKVPSVNHMFAEKLPPNRKMQAITKVHGIITDSNLEEERKVEINARLDELLVEYLSKGKILEKLDNPDKPLHIRAFMLVSMVQPEMLPQGRSLELARSIIVKHLKRPNFQSELVAAIEDPKEKAVTLRKFHERLNRSGFFG